MARFDIVEKSGVKIAVVKNKTTLITDEQSAVDFMSEALEKTGCDRVIVDKCIVPEEFYDLSSGLAGSILQKFVNYRVKIAFVGDFSVYESRSLRDFIYESNKGSNVFFLPTQQEAIDKLSLV